MQNWLAKLLGIESPSRQSFKKVGVLTVDITPDISKFRAALRDYSQPLTLWEEAHPAFASVARSSSQAGLASIQRWTGNYWERPTDTPIYDELRAMADLEDEGRATQSTSCTVESPCEYCKRFGIGGAL